jgi:regulator of sigma E protease
MLTSFIVFLVFFFALSFMIFIHEFGHFMAARWVGVEVEEFGFGLPSKKLVTLFTWQGTEFTIHALPLGGFVRPKGENDPDIPGGLASASPWKRLIVLFAGPLMNLVTAVVIFALLVALEGIPVPGAVQIGAVMKDSPAEKSGIQTNDILLSVNGEKITEIEPTIVLIKSHLDEPVTLLFKRGSEEVTITATPSSKRVAANQGALGIELMYANRRSATLKEIATGGALITTERALMILYIPVAIVQGVIAPADARVVGFKGIFDMFSFAIEKDLTSRQEAASTPKDAPPPLTTNFTLNLIGMLSISLGVMNLLPIPALDGGRILFTMPEILFHRRIPPERENIVNGVAMLILIVLMIFVNVMDFINPLQIPPR